MNMNLDSYYSFEDRHNGPTLDEIKSMLDLIGVSDLEELIDQTIPSSIRLNQPLNIKREDSEFSFLEKFRKIAKKNKIFKSFIGLGYYDTLTPSVILRNILENPSWYTAYTPYQAEIAQGRLEALINFQTMVMDLTSMEIANASLLDESTSAAEAMSMLFWSKSKTKKNANKFFVDKNIFEQTKDLLITRSLPIGIELVIDSLSNINIEDPNLFGLIIQYPNSSGEVIDHTELVKKAKDNNLSTCFITDLLSLTLLKPPGEFGADVVVGTTQRFGVPMGYGGPHAAFFATKQEYKRQIPGRIIGLSIDKSGDKAYRMALQTREQHIKREKATSNICTAQVLLAVIASMYAVYHGPHSLKKIATNINTLAKLTATKLESLGYIQTNKHFFDTISISVNNQEMINIKSRALLEKINFRYESNLVLISFDELKTLSDINTIAKIFNLSELDVASTNLLETGLSNSYPNSLERKTKFLTSSVFNDYHSEHEMLRYIKRLESKDISLVHSMIPLGSCTMKLNATSEMIPISWPEFNQIHPFSPVDQTEGYQYIFKELKSWLNQITGFYDTSLQPNSGAQGEYAGLMVIRAYHVDRGDHNRNIVLIPTSAHGTNPASAIMAGMKVVLVKCDQKGNIDIEDLNNKAKLHSENLAALMITYPSTHGVFEEAILEICDIIHQNGGQVYMDGANMNAQVGLTSPAKIGADVCHLNLHKTFCIPHGGGGPGVGPICVAKHLAVFLPSNPIIKTGGNKAINSISGAPFGSASILPISYAYISMMGSEGITNATKIAILNSNYIKARLESYYNILYTNELGRTAHEMILDLRPFKDINIEVEDIAKRLMDYGYHAPTVSFPVAGTLMIEPTESETKKEIDKFCEAMISIRMEIKEIEDNLANKENNVLKNSPHTAKVLLSDDWNYPYTREKAAYPLEWVKENKFWPSVSRIDSAYGDRNLICSCNPIEDYE